MVSEKRKHEAIEISVEPIEDVSNSVVVGSFFNGLEVPTTTNFELYQHKKHNNKILMHGENEALSYDGEAAQDQQYCIGIYDPVSKKLELIKTNLIPSKITSKSINKKSIPSIKQLNVQRNIQRNLLGEEFGTKKAKKAILDLERNKIDSGKLETDQIEIIDSIKVNTSRLPTKVEMEAKMNESRIIPNFNIEATAVEDIYPLENIVDLSLLQSIRVDSLLNKSLSAEELMDLLPFNNSRFLLKKLTQYLSNESNLTLSLKKTKLQMIYYISILFGLYSNRKLHTKNDLLEEFNSQPSNDVIDSVLQQFTIKQSSSSKHRYQIDPKSEDKLLCYLLCLALKIDDYSLEVSPLAQELSVKPSKLGSLFKSLGCLVKNITVKECESLGLNKSLVSSYKIASLKVPFKAPEIARRGGNGGGR